MRLPYFYQQMLGFLAVIFTMLIITGFFLLQFARNTALNDTEETLFSYAEALVEENLTLIELGRAQNLLSNQDVMITVFNEEQAMIYPQLPNYDAPSLNEESLNNLKKGERLSLAIYQNDILGNSQESAIIYLPFFQSGNRDFSGYVAVSAPVTWIDEEMTELRENLMYTLLISAIGSIVISLLFAQYQVKRINKLRTATHEVTEGNFSIRLDHKDRDEVDELAADFNTMINSLEESTIEIERQEERRKNFMADAAHEMRTPLTTINGLLEGMEYEIIPETQKKRSIQLMRKETARLIRLVNENLDYENIRANKIQLHKQTIRVKEVFHTVASQLSEQAEESGNKIVVDAEDNLVVYADYDRLIQIVFNLVKNSIQFTSNGTIILKAKEQEEYTIICIQDNGLGMSEDEQKNIWDRYYKADLSRRNTRFGESGLGLSIVQQLISLHDGKIQVESELQKGTTFIIHLKKKDN
ncbi:sensor histidine kinase [Lacticigenium naphthae]|uniref:sensor histidine kinase n=1 Tax=Lacticigenium naphthae TaxID=515351 RepID=UPI00041FC6DB|nr:HAMP domain-containing sensor histidine kinase [Lacticigenium naphthae]